MKCGRLKKWRLYKTSKDFKKHIRDNLLDLLSLAAEHLSEERESGNLFGHVQCDIEVPENLRAIFANVPPIFEITLVSRDDIGDLIKTYTEEEGILSKPRKISNFASQNGALITLLLSFCLNLGLVCTNIHHSVEYISGKKFNSFVDAAVDARRQSNENPNSSVVAEAILLETTSSYGYQFNGWQLKYCDKRPQR